jgi:hypothetical protein
LQNQHADNKKKRGSIYIIALSSCIDSPEKKCMISKEEQMKYVCKRFSFFLLNIVENRPIIKNIKKKE